MKTVPGIADLAPVGRYGRGRPGHNLLIERVVAESKKGEHARETESGSQR